MARPWRIELEGALYHVLSRGNEQKDIFRDNDDRMSFLNCLGEMSARFETDIFADVLMGNHYHILLRTNRANLSRAMQWMGAIYTLRFNNRHLRPADEQVSHEQKYPRAAKLRNNSNSLNRKSKRDPISSPDQKFNYFVNRFVKLNVVPSNKPLSLSLRSGITKSDIKDKVINGALSFEPI